MPRPTAYPLASFLIPLAVRLIPEWLSYPYPIGFDTIAYYIPIMLSRIALRASLMDYLVGTILLYLPLTIVSTVSGNVILTMKLVPALLVGLLGLASYSLGRRYLNWGTRRSLGLALVLCSYFVTLRISWDLQRNVLGLILVLATVAMLEDRHSRTHYLAFPAVSGLAVMTHEASAALVEIIAAAHLSAERRYRVLTEWLPFLPAALLALLQLLTRSELALQIQEGPRIPGALAAVQYNSGFLLFAYGLILPLALIGLKSGIRRHLSLWAVVCLFFGLLPNTGMPTGASYRWSLLLVFPLAVLFMQGISVLNSVKGNWERSFGRSLVAGSLLAILIVSSGYVGLSSASRQYFGLAPQYRSLMPTSMVESTISIADIPSVKSIANWADQNLPHAALLILPFQLYGWYVMELSSQGGLVYAPTEEPVNVDETIAAIQPRSGPQLFYANSVDVYDYQGAELLTNLASQLQVGTSSLYVVWWSPDSPEQPSFSLPASFVVVHQAGSFAIFSFGS